MTDGLIRSFMITRQPSYTPPGEFIMSRGLIGTAEIAAIVATLAVAAGAARGADRDVSAAAATGACAGLPGHD
ncbi:MAG TPA: hypothetical protein VJ303_01555, partial [Steroidobacteraceae bacterium]|nr:hypothetical protein [Steroidobacteraceae bacterium]